MSLIWRLGPEQAAEWRAIRLAALADAPDAFGSTLADWQDRPLADFAERLRDTHCFASGPAPGQPQAVAAWATEDESDEAWLVGIWAHPDIRGRGVTRALIRHVMEDAAAAGMRVIYLGVGEYNTPAQNLYRSLGFQSLPRSSSPNERGVVEIVMQCPL